MSRSYSKTGKNNLCLVYHYLIPSGKKSRLIIKMVLLSLVTKNEMHANSTLNLW